MKMPRFGSQRDGDAQHEDLSAATAAAASTASAAARSAPSEGKGRPTPKRRDAEARRRGPVAPAPMTAKEARARRKATRGSRAERKAEAAARRSAAADRRARMMAGEEKYLLARDKGPVRGFARDYVDSRRTLLGLFIPVALMVFLTLFLAPRLQALVTLVVFVLMIFLVIDGVLLARRVNRAVAERFPESTDGGMRLGWYVFVRASQLRRMRAPKPRVSPGDPI